MANKKVGKKNIEKLKLFLAKNAQLQPGSKKATIIKPKS